MRPDGSDLRGVALPKTCSPQTFTRGDVLVCLDFSDEADLEHWQYAVVPKGHEWRRVAIPRELTLPRWAGPDQYEVDAVQWSPSRDRVAYVRAGERALAQWFSATGDVAVAEPDGSNEHVLAAEGEAPQWSPDGERLAFARCLWPEGDDANRLTGHGAVRCTLWTIEINGDGQPRLLVKDAQSVPKWSPDGRFIAFLRRLGSCDDYCGYRIFVVPSTGGEERAVGPKVSEPSDGSGSWDGLTWLAAPTPTESSAPQPDELELQRCVDIWNRARMSQWPYGLLNVSVVGGLCQVTVANYGGICTQSTEMPFRYWCPSHGAGLHMLPSEYRVWNAHRERGGGVRLFEPPKGPRLPLPKAPSYPLLDGFVVPYAKDGEPLSALKLSDVTGSCSWFEELSDHLPEDYPMRCWWGDSGNDHCFKPPGQLKVGDFALCPDYWYKKRYDPLGYVRVKIASIE